MRKLLMVATLLLSATACVRTDVVQLGIAPPTPRPVVHADSVAVFATEADVPGEFIKVALIKAEGPSGYTTAKSMIQKLRQDAGKLGANGLILNQIKEPSAGAKVAGAVFGVAPQREGEVVAIIFRRKP